MIIVVLRRTMRSPMVSSVCVYFVRVSVRTSYHHRQKSLVKDRYLYRGISRYSMCEDLKRLRLCGVELRASPYILIIYLACLLCYPAGLPPPTEQSFNSAQTITAQMIEDIEINECPHPHLRCSRWNKPCLTLSCWPSYRSITHIVVTETDPSVWIPGESGPNYRNYQSHQTFTSHSTNLGRKCLTNQTRATQ